MNPLFSLLRNCKKYLRSHPRCIKSESLHCCPNQQKLNGTYITFHTVYRTKIVRVYALTSNKTVLSRKLPIDFRFTFVQMCKLYFFWERKFSLGKDISRIGFFQCLTVFEHHQSYHRYFNPSVQFAVLYTQGMGSESVPIRI